MQNMSGILEVAIGLVFVYLLLSLICSALTEAVENLFNRSRGKKLCEGLYGLFGGNIDHDSSFALLKAFYQSPMIYGLYQGDLALKQQPAKTSAIANPAPAGGQDTGAAAPATNTPPPQLQLPKNLPSYITPKTFALAFVDQILAGKALDTATLISQINASATLPEHLKNSLTLMVNKAEGDIHAALNNIEDWYSAMGERVSGWYKKHAQQIAIMIALLIAVLGNVDTITIAKSLMANGTLREQMVNAADQFYKDRLLADKQQALETKSASNPDQAKQIEADISAIKTQATDKLVCQSQPDNPNKCFNLQMARLAELNQMGLPISWQDLDDPRIFPRTPLAWLEKIFGLLITAIAVSLGAPFWFDVLNKFMNFRSTLKPQPASSQALTKPQQSGTGDPTPGVG
ncbi:MAG: hypothetical protein CTY16_11715 [Methylobacter sp.]|nr:MAG: hypothetical protein CTY16_11715 [Methylobacter sp.]